MLIESEMNNLSCGAAIAAPPATSSNPQLSLRVLRSIDEFADLAEFWSAWTDGPEADLDYFSIRLRHAAGIVRPHVMVVSSDGRPDCMLVGWLENGKVEFKAGSVILFRCNGRVLRFVNGGFLGNQSPANCRFLLREIIQSLETGEAQAAEFSQLRVDSPLYELVRREPSVFSRDFLTAPQTHRYTVLPASFGAYIRGLSRKNRKNLKRHVRILERDFPAKVRFKFVHSDRDVEWFAREADAIAKKSYRRALGIGFINNLEIRETLHAAARKEGLRACLLYVAGEPVAFACGIICSKTLHGTFTGYDPAFRKYAPGLQTLLRLIEESFVPSGAIARLDTGCGDSPYKRVLCASRWTETPVWLFAPSPKGFGLHVRKMISTLLHSLALRLMQNDHVRKMKRTWERRAIRQLQFEAKL